MDLEENRIYYSHNGDCGKDNFTELSEKGLKICKDCAGVFDKDGKGVAVQDKRFDK